MYYAAEKNRIDAAKCLIKYGADVNAKERIVSIALIVISDLSLP